MTTRRLVKAVIGALAMAVVLAGAPTPATSVPLPDIDGDHLNSANAYAYLDARFSSQWFCTSVQENRVISVHEGQTVNRTFTYDCGTYSVWVNFASNDIDPINGIRPAWVQTQVDIQVFDSIFFGNPNPELCAHQTFAFFDETSGVSGFRSDLSASCPGMTFSLLFERFYMETSAWADCWEHGVNCPI
jgi:hypothetical protein